MYFFHQLIEFFLQECRSRCARLEEQMEEVFVINVHILVSYYRVARNVSVVDPDLQMRGGGGGGGVVGGGCGGGSSKSGDKRGARSPKNFFSALWASVWSENKVGPPLNLPLCLWEFIFAVWRFSCFVGTS